MTTLLNILTVDPVDRDELLDLLQANTDAVIRTLDGWISTTLIASSDGTRVIIYSQWRDAPAVEAMRTDARMVACFPKFAALASLESLFGEVAYATAA